MALTDEERNSVATTLDRCDTALAGKPTLGRIFGRTWRANFRERILAADSLVDFGFPEAYYVPCLDMPADYQQRIEEGASLLLTVLKGRDRKDFRSRLQGRDSGSATEELLLARGFFSQFGKIEPPAGNPAARRAEFTVFVQGHSVAIEARGLRNSSVVQTLKESSWRCGQPYWLSADPDIGNPVRVRKALAEKILESADNLPRIIVLSLYSPFDILNGISFARQMALKPGSFDIPQTKFPLGVAATLASYRQLQGLWFNPSVVERLCFSRNTQNEIAAAIKDSFYPRENGVLLTDDIGVVP